jgi:hypothetical protein
MLFGILKQRNEAYLGDTWRELGDLYTGGYQILASAKRYLPQMVGEGDERYAERVKVAAYLCYLGQIVDFFVANLFSHELKVAPAADANDPNTPGGEPEDHFYVEFAHDADRKGTTFVKLMRACLTTALVKGSALIGYDFPRREREPASRAEEEAWGTDRAYAFEIPVEQLIDWELDEDEGTFEFAILHRQFSRRASPAEMRSGVVDEFKVWTMRDGKAHFDIYRTKPHPADKPPADKDDVPLVDSGDTQFTSIPMLRLELSDGLWVGNKIGPAAKEHFQRRNILTAAENKSLFAIPFVQLGSEIGAPGMALPSEVQQNPNRGEDPRVALANKGYLVLGSGDNVDFAEPSGSCYAVVESQLRDLKDEMFRVVHQMAASVSNIGASLGRSGDSKQEDRQSTAIVLGALGSAVRDFAKRIYTAVSEARKDDVVWVPHGLDQYDGDARELVLQEAVQAPQIQIPSNTWRKAFYTQLALRLLPNIEPETADVIRKEIAASSETSGVAPGAPGQRPPDRPATPNPLQGTP